MAAVYVSFGIAGHRATSGGGVPVRHGNPTSTEIVTTSGTSAATTNSASVDGIASIYSDADHYAVVGASPTAAAGTGWFVQANQSFEIGVNSGDKVALITV